MTTNQKKNIAIAGATFVSAVLLPVLVFAQSTTLTSGGTAVCAPVTGSTGANAGTILCTAYNIIKIVIPVLILGAVAYFIWGIVEFITAKDAEEKSKSRGQMIHGIIGFVVILGLWGLVNVLLNTFSLNNNQGASLNLPSF